MRKKLERFLASGQGEHVQTKDEEVHSPSSQHGSGFDNPFNLAMRHYADATFAAWESAGRPPRKPWLAD